MGLPTTTGTINGYIDFEGAITAPLWLAAEVVDWVPDPMSDRTAWWGGTRADQFRLWKTFHSTMVACDIDGEWQKAYEGGKHFRRWAGYPRSSWETWAKCEATVDETVIWASQEGNRGVGMPEIDKELGINWEVADRKSVLKRYGPDPEGTEEDEPDESDEFYESDESDESGESDES